MRALKTTAYVLLVTVMVAAKSALAQGSILNKTIDKTTLNPIAGAEITYTQKADTSIKYTQWTNASGEALFSNLATPIERANMPLPAQNANIEIFNLMGQTIQTIHRKINLQTYTINDIWDGNNQYGNPVSAGIYFLKIQSGRNTIVQRIINLKTGEVKAASKKKIIKLGKITDSKEYDVKITHENYNEYNTTRTINDGDNGEVTDKLEKIATTGWGEIIGRAMIDWSNHASLADITYILESDTTKKWHRVANPDGVYFMDSLIVNLPESQYKIRIKPTQTGTQFMPREFTRIIKEGDNGQVIDTVYAIPNERIVRGTISKIISEFDTQKYEGYQGATVNIIKKGEEEPLKTTTTNPKGEYNLGFIPAGEYQLEINPNDTTYFNRGTNYNGESMDIIIADRETLSDSINTGRKNAVLIKKMQWVPGTTADSISFGIRQNYNMTYEVMIRDPPTVAGWTEINTNGTKIYLKDMTEYEKQRLKEIMAEGDSLFFGNRINPWIFINEEIDERNLGNNYAAGNYEKLGWNIISGESTTSDEGSPSKITENSVIIGGRVSLGPTNRASVFKEMYGRIPGFMDTIQESYMNTQGRDPPTLRDRAMFSMFYKFNKAMGTDRKEDWTFKTVILP